MKITLAVMTALQVFAGGEIAQETSECDPHYSGVCVPFIGQR